MDENKLLERLKHSADSVDAPDSLKPEAVREKLQGRKQNRRKPPLYQMAAAAAVLLIALVGIWQVRYLADPEGSGNNAGVTAQKETEAREEAAAVTEAADTTAPAALSSETDTDAEDSAIPHPKSEEELYQALSKISGTKSDRALATGATAETTAATESYAMDEGTVYEAGAADAATPQETASAASKESGTGDYSETNLQEAGVDEGDVVKTDGTYLYILRKNGQVRIVKAEGGSLKEASTIHVPDNDMKVEEMYLDGDRLILVASGSSSTMRKEKEDVYSVDQRQFSRLYTFDISDRSKPALAGSTEQEGIYRASRKTGDYVYLFTEFNPVVLEAREASTILPKAGGEDMLIDDIFLPESPNQSSYLVITSIDVNKPDKLLDRKAIVSAAEMFYVSTENIYISLNNYNGSGNTTQILKFHYEDGRVSAVGAGEVRGYLNDSFSLNESNGYLRVVSTDWDDSDTVNRLYVLDEDLNICGQIDDLAPGETIKSARFLGDAGYFVTFRETDPLFSVDLSDPRNPKILGELKITGFSSYLHFYGENKLLGLGQEVSAKNGRRKGIKLSMFDISDPSDVKESDKYVVKGQYDSPGLYNYKAIMIDTDKNIFGFESEGVYMVFSYQEGEGFVNKFLYTYNEASANYYDYYYDNDNVRGMFIGDTLYLTSHNGVKAFDMANGYEQIGELTF